MSLSPMCPMCPMVQFLSRAHPVINYILVTNLVAMKDLDT